VTCIGQGQINHSGGPLPIWSVGPNRPILWHIDNFPHDGRCPSPGNYGLVSVLSSPVAFWTWLEIHFGIVWRPQNAPFAPICRCFELEISNLKHVFQAGINYRQVLHVWKNRRVRYIENNENINTTVNLMEVGKRTSHALDYILYDIYLH